MQVVETLEVIGSLDAFNALEGAIDDTVRDIRIAVVRILSGRKYEAALTKVQARVLGEEIRQADLTEKKAFFEAYGVLSGADSVSKLSVSKLAPMLLPRGFMKRKEDPETRACAAMALGKIATAEAVTALKQASGDRDPMVRNAVKRALQELK